MKSTELKIRLFLDYASRFFSFLAILSLATGLVSSALNVSSRVFFIVVFVIFMVSAPMAIISGISFVILSRRIMRESQFISINRPWDERNDQGKCGRCGKSFTDNNPDGGGGQCINCWADNQL